MDPETLAPILVPVLGASVMITLTGLCCIRSMVTRNTIELRNRLAEVEQRLQYQIQQIHRVPTAPLETTRPEASCPPTPQHQPLQAYYYNPPPYYTISNYT